MKKLNGTAQQPSEAQSAPPHGGDVRLPPGGYFSTRESSCSCRDASWWEEKNKNAWLMASSSGSLIKGVRGWWLTRLFTLICCLGLSIQTLGTRVWAATAPWRQKRFHSPSLTGRFEHDCIWNLPSGLVIDSSLHIIMWHPSEGNRRNSHREASFIYSLVSVEEFLPAPSLAPLAE